VLLRIRPAASAQVSGAPWHPWNSPLESLGTPVYVHHEIVSHTYVV